MTELLALLFGFPVVIFTALMGLVLLYWLLVVLGALDVDVLDLGMVEGLDTLDGALDGALEGAAEGVEGAEGESGGAAGILQALGIHGVPLTVSMSIVIFASWMLTAFAMLFLREQAPGLASSMLVGMLVGTAGLGLGLVLAGQAVKPLRPAFATVQAPRRHHFVGRVCTLLTSRVDGEAGRAEIDDGGAGLIVDVRCSRENTLGRGDQALVFDYDPRTEVFHVVPVDAALEARPGEVAGGGAARTRRHT